MSWLTAIPVIGDLLSKGLDKAFPDKSKSREQQTEMNKLEIQGAPQSKVRLWRSYLMITICLCLLYVVIVQPIILLYWPNAKIPTIASDSVEVMWKILIISIGGAF